MRFLTDITLEHAIAHHLDHLLPEKIISRQPLHLTEGLRLYLSDHILAVSRLGSLTPARFTDETGDVASACRELLANDRNFAASSGKIAERLFRAMGANRAASPGLLIVARVRNNVANKSSSRC